MPRHALLRLRSCCILLLAFAVSSPASARMAERAYVPENLGQLSVRGQIRIIETEYSEQSGGRGIADDQLDFYLDRIRDSRWTFSRIQSDISGSLGGNGNNARRPADADPRQILCESQGARYQQCSTGFRGTARLTRQLSQNACQEGRSWGQSRGLVWVSLGCRAWFEDTNWNSGGSEGNNGYPGNSAPAPAPAATASVASVDLGNAVGPDMKLTAITTNFKPKDTITVSIGITTSDPAATVAGQVGARWTYRYGTDVLVVSDETKDLKLTGASSTNFQIAKPNGFPVGNYQVQVSLNGAVVQSKDFNVTK